MDAATVLSSGVAKVPTGSGSIPTAGPSSIGVPTDSDVVPTAGPIFATVTVVTPYTRRKGKEKMIESETPKKKKIQEDAEIVRIQAEGELQMMINSLDRSNEIVVKYLQEFEQIPEDLSIGEMIELISDLVKYQENYAQVLKYQTLQRKPRSKKQKKDYYMAVIKGHAGWKTKDFKGMSFKQIEPKFNTVWNQIKDFILMGSKEETERFKRKGLRLEQVSEKKLKTSKEVLEEVKATEEVPEDKVKEMMQLVPVEEVYVEALQVKHPIIDWKVHTEGQRSYWKITRLGGSLASYQFFVDMLKHLETLSIRPPTSDKEIELWVELKRLYEPDNKDQIWTHTQNLMHALVEWKLYDTCGVHHVTSKDKEIFMLVEKEYPLRKGLAIVMISYKLQVENYSQMGRIDGNKMHKAFPLPVMEFPLPEEVLTASEESSHCQKKRDATAVKIHTATKVKKSNCNCNIMYKDSLSYKKNPLVIVEGLQVKQKLDGIFISQDKYVDETLRKFKYADVKPASTPMDKEKALLKDLDGDDVDVYLYRSMIGSLMYLTSSRPDIMFAVCTCARFQVNPKVSHLHEIKRIFRYLKGQPKLGLCYPRDSPLDLVGYTDSDYAGASLDKKSTSGGCQFLGCRLISW
nr:uncharacterized mitochondrial protein AtMg00810-like [Tanacetum cinerariifolium]